MKRLLIALSCLMLVLFALPAWAEASASGDFEYTPLGDGTVEITKYNGNAEALEIPSELDGYRVSRLGNQSFYQITQLRSVIVPKGVLAIGDNAFIYCEKPSGDLNPRWRGRNRQRSVQRLRA